MRFIAAPILAVLIAAISTPAQAKHHHSKVLHHAYVAHAHGHSGHRARAYAGRRHLAAGASVASRGGYSPPGETPLGGLAGGLARYLGTNPTGVARNWCGIGLGMVARALGYRPPAGYALAANWQHFGQAVGPTPGAIMVMPHHVAVVVAVLGNGKVRTISANHGHRVGYGDYAMSLAIAWRSPG